MKLTTTYLALGSNLGDRRSNLTQAIHEISKTVGTIDKVSKFYRTEPLNPANISSQPEFMNAVLSCSTSFSPEELLLSIQRTEALLGLDRETKIPWGPRIIDIDILTYGDTILDTKSLRIPHKEMSNRDFVLVPLEEIAPDFAHPINGKLIKTLISELKENGAATHVIAPINK